MRHKVSPYTPEIPITIRMRERFEWSPPSGHRQGWTEWQCVQGRRVISRHDLESQAKKAKAAFESSATAGAACPCCNDAMTARRDEPENASE